MSRAGENSCPVSSLLYVDCEAPAMVFDQSSAAALLRGLASENWEITYMEAREKGKTSDRGFLAGLPARFYHKYRYLRKLALSIRNHDVVCIGASDSRAMIRLALPALVLARFFGKAAALRFDYPQAEQFLEKRGAWFRTMLKAGSPILVGSRYLEKAVGRYKLSAQRIAGPVDFDGLEHRVISQPQPKMLISCPLEPGYNVVCLLRAFEIVKQKFPRAELVIEGDGSEYRKLKRWVEKGKLHGVEFVRAGNLTELNALYKECDLYVHSASSDESPTAIVRAFAAGLPVVTTDADGLLHMVRDGSSALVVPVNDHVAMANRILDLVQDEVLCRKLSEQGEVEIRRHTWTRVRQDWINFFNRIDSELYKE